jgi:hypothetical protein
MAIHLIEDVAAYLLKDESIVCHSCEKVADAANVKAVLRWEQVAWQSTDKVYLCDRCGKQITC